MKKTIYLFFICSVAYGQNIWKDLNYNVLKYSSIYETLEIEDKKSLIIAFNTNNFDLHNSHYLIISKEEAMIAQIHYTSTDYGKNLLEGKGVDLKNHLKKMKVRRNDIDQTIKIILKNNYLQNVIQKDLDRPCIQDEQGKYIYSPMGPSHDVNYNIELYQGNKYYKLQALSPEYDDDRSREKLDQFLELYKLLETTWDKINSNAFGNFIINQK